ncbi:PMT family glycosyltransferase, 4-amino-4-deoxy-L-arabinose transferase [Aequorivita sublithincola DSM 14238]|uniref:PMT family glycosyltransferase, 4-amino-4-deoxy-L-arabinose transferase n=1 Tax=Aequorivita sublithincola (strain DSM 14238 / LMG 21431 / ACAM 643 / 9-3) TaxID=746697 RepID=I3YXD8_AEQSU|nr:glycosyltransferase family 39 protein [Aequorivita sublithincola]AFL81656.1 PMT family glycosyltransferase, 4-amino-4-deoxy-L-arabinose transferase [Aequorivita sublithincola DSM 14238]
MKIEKNYLLLLLITCAAIFFVNLNSLPVNIMEARNFITAREMLQDGNWLLTTINGEPRYQKPPLPTWLTAFSAAIFGIKTIWALRLPAAIMSLILVLFSYKLATKLTSEKLYAFISSLVLATSFYIVASARDGQWDIYTHGFMMGCIYLLYLFFTEETHKYRNALLAGLFFGCSFLSKGPVSFYALLLPFLIAFGIVYKYKNFKSRWLPLIAFLIVATIVSTWWHWYTLKFDPAAAEITKKETTNWISYETKPFYYYWSFFTQSGVWTIPAFIALIYPYLKNRVFNKKAYFFTFLWTMISVILLSLIPEKKSRYLLPVLIPMALNTGFYIEYLFRKFKKLKDKRETIPVYFNFGLIAFIGIAFPIGGYIFLKDGLAGNWVWFVLLSIALLTIAVLMYRNLFRRKIESVFYLTIAFIVMVIWFGLPLSAAITDNPEYKPFSEANTFAKEKNIEIYEFSDMTPELIWDYGEKMKILREDENILIPEENQFGVMVSDNNHESFEEAFSEFNKEFIVRYDMNPKGKDSRTHKNRLYRDLFVVTKK